MRPTRAEVPQIIALAISFSTSVALWAEGERNGATLASERGYP